MSKKVGLVLVLVVLFGVGVFFMQRGEKKEPPCSDFLPGRYRQSGEISQIGSQVCLGKVEPTLNILTNIISFPVTFVDKKGKGFSYNAIVGGKDRDGQDRRVSLCVIKDDVMNCNYVNTYEILPRLNTDKIWIEMTYSGDDRNWGEPEMTVKDLEFYNKLRNAVESGESFPIARKEFNLHVSQIVVDESNE